MIGRPRRRPRVHSASFKVFGWLVLRVAAWAVYSPMLGVEDLPLSARRFMLRSSTNVHRTATRLLKLYPERRYYS